MNSAFYPKRPPCDPANPMPRYQQLRDWLETQIRSGALSKGDKLPAEREWAPALGVSQMTLNHAIQGLVRDGFIIREVGRGTFIADLEKPVVPAHIGLVLHWRKDSDGGHYGASMLHGIYNLAATRPAKFSFAWGAEGADPPPEYYVDLAAEMGVDGLLLVMPPAYALPQILTLQETGLPFIVAGASWESYAIASVDFDNGTGAELAARHLLELGHRRIGIVNGATYLRSSMVRTARFQRVLEEAGIPASSSYEVTSSSFQMDAGATRRLKELSMSGDGPTAWFAAGYYLSMQTVEMMQSLGLHIPTDVSVVGFGDPYTAAYMNPPLTTVRHPIEALGELATTRLLDDVARGAQSSETDMLPVEFVIRESTAPPRK
ncbi:MAG TPA: GntR family transcriptional regulator [Armatimonadota bacterium]